jgi:thiol-disulfide isomerase/thioredoxin
MKKNNPVWILAITMIFTLVILNIVIFVRVLEYNEKINYLKINKSINASFKGKTETGRKCPNAEGGLEDAFLQVKYFYSKFCPWCMKEEPILRKLVKNYGNLIHILWYDIANCPQLVDNYEISGVPTFVFSTFYNKTEYSHYGFIYEKDLVKLICDVVGDCETG